LLELGRNVDNQRERREPSYRRHATERRCCCRPSATTWDYQTAVGELVHTITADNGQ